MSRPGIRAIIGVVSCKVKQYGTMSHSGVTNPTFILLTHNDNNDNYFIYLIIKIYLFIYFESHIDDMRKLVIEWLQSNNLSYLCNKLLCNILLII